MTGCDWCGRAATTTDEDGDPACGRCQREDVLRAVLLREVVRAECRRGGAVGHLPRHKRLDEIERETFDWDCERFLSRETRGRTSVG